MTTDYGCIFSTAGEAITTGAACYLSSGEGGLTAGRAYLASSALAYSSTGADLVGVATAPATAGNQVRLRVLGVQDGYSGLTAGQLQYVGTGGAITATAPAANARPLGLAISATEIQLTSTAPAGAEVAITPTLSGAATAYTGQTLTLTITNWASYGGSRAAWCQLVDSVGAVATAATATTDNGDGTISIPLPAGAGTYSAQVRCSQFGATASATAEHEVVLTVLPSYRYWRLAYWDGNQPGVKDWRLFTGSGPGAGTVETTPPADAGAGGSHGTRYPTQIMTGGSSPSPYVATHSYAYSASYEAWKAFDNNSSSQWWALGHNQPAAAADWVQIDLGAAVAIQSVWAKFNNAQGLTIEASNDALSWTNLGTTTIAGSGINGTWIL